MNHIIPFKFLLSPKSTDEVVFRIKRGLDLFDRVHNSAVHTLQIPQYAQHHVIRFYRCWEGLLICIGDLPWDLPERSVGCCSYLEIFWREAWAAVRHLRVYHNPAQSLLTHLSLENLLLQSSLQTGCFTAQMRGIRRNSFIKMWLSDFYKISQISFSSPVCK